MQIVTCIVTGLSMGTTVLLGQRIGHKDDEGSALTVGTSIKVFSILGITLSFVMVLAAKPIAHWMNAPEEAFGELRRAQVQVETLEWLSHRLV